MSNYTVCEQKFLEQDVLIDSLDECGISRDKISIYDKPRLLEGYHGTSEGIKSKIIIHAKAFGNDFDIGFIETAEGFQPHIVDMDARKKVATTITGGSLIQTYGKNKVIAEVKKKFGWNIKAQTKLENGRIQIRVGVR